ncbi:hypothetical protein IV102_05010 [bacterium]|nr:hypothetical protein [bacterium]
MKILSNNNHKKSLDRSAARDALFKDPKYLGFRDKVDIGTFTAIGGALGYLGGVGGGLALSHMGGNVAYTYLGPSVGPLLGGLWGAAAQTGNKGLVMAARTATCGVAGTLVGDGIGHGLTYLIGSSAYSWTGAGTGAALGAMINLAVDDKPRQKAWTTAAVTTGLTGAGISLGDAIGRGLSQLTGNPLYAAIGPAAGGLNGALGGLTFNLPEGKLQKLTENALPSAFGLVTGATAGCLAGALLTYITGAPIYNTVAPLLGAFAGTATGAALTLNRSDKR